MERVQRLRLLGTETGVSAQELRAGSRIRGLRAVLSDWILRSKNTRGAGQQWVRPAMLFKK